MVKFNEIPQLTRMPDHYTNVGLGYLKKRVEDDTKEMGLQLCPDFQRGHVWTEAQQIAYVEYLLRGGHSGRDIYFNCPGWHSGELGEHVCVDGLQRLTALLRFVNNEISAFGVLCDDYEDRLRTTNSIVWHVNDLKTKKEVLVWYLEMNDGGTPHTQEELDRVKRMIDNG